MAVSQAFQLLKGYTSYHIRKFQPWRKNYKAMWSKFTFSRTVGSVTGGVIEHYIKESNSQGQYGNQLSLKQF
jgi:REP element-mobilizing transposase RayT